MLIINTESKTMAKNKKIHLFINNIFVETLSPNEVKKYNLEPGKYNIQLKVAFYQSLPQCFEIDNQNKRHVYVMKFKESWNFIIALLLMGALGLLFDYFIRQSYGNQVGNIFIVLYFVGLYLINYRVNKYRYLKLEKV
ncbi:hypothetical protein KHQ82_00265 [Mycoplasmatota bacterium]|nr:hypothetical protein KHQ82_00265 [Mycoplasmatota bacterium]